MRKEGYVIKKLISLISMIICVLSLFSTSTFATTTYTKCTTVVASYPSLIGITVAKHTANTTYTYNTLNQLVASPKSVANSYWTAPLNSCTGISATWDWYTPGTYGTGQSNCVAKFVFGVATQWVTIGSTYQSTILTTVKYNGISSCKII